MLLAEKLALAALIVSAGCCHPAHAAWSGFDQPVSRLCSFGSPLRDRYAAVVLAGRFETGSGRAMPLYSLVFTADDGTPEISGLGIRVDERDVARFDAVSHVPASPGASAVVALDPEMLGTLFRATDNARVLHIRILAAGPTYDFDLAGFATAADTFTDCMLRNAP